MFNCGSGLALIFALGADSAANCEVPLGGFEAVSAISHDAAIGGRSASILAQHQEANAPRGATIGRFWVLSCRWPARP
jgi:hypothetical protein